MRVNEATSRTIGSVSPNVGNYGCLAVPLGTGATGCGGTGVVGTGPGPCVGAGVGVGVGVGGGCTGFGVGLGSAGACVGCPAIEALGAGSAGSPFERQVTSRSHWSNAASVDAPCRQ
jgi:hypothetical protein